NMPDEDEPFEWHTNPTAESFEIRLHSGGPLVKRILLADSAAPSSDNGGQTFRIRYESQHNRSAIALRHNNRANAFFMDGHAEALGHEEILALGFVEKLIYTPQENH